MDDGDTAGPGRAPRRATAAVPGSEERIAEYARRAARRERVTDPRDGCRDGAALKKVTVPGHSLDTTELISNYDYERRLWQTAAGHADFGARLHYLRSQRGMGLRELAAAAGMEDSALGKLERGHRSPTLPTLIALARALKVSRGCLAGDGPPAYQADA